MRLMTWWSRTKGPSGWYPAYILLSEGNMNTKKHEYYSINHSNKVRDTMVFYNVVNIVTANIQYHHRTIELTNEVVEGLMYHQETVAHELQTNTAKQYQSLVHGTRHDGFLQLCQHRDCEHIIPPQHHRTDL